MMDVGNSLSPYTFFPAFWGFDQLFRNNKAVDQIKTEEIEKLEETSKLKSRIRHVWPRHTHTQLIRAFLSRDQKAVFAHALRYHL